MNHYNVYGLKVSNYELSEVAQLFDQTLSSKKSVVIFGYSFGFIPSMKMYPDLYPIVNSCDLLVCDGTPFNWFCRLSGFKLKTVMSIPDMTNFTLEYANKNNLSVLLFGATKEVNDRAVNMLSKKYPNVVFHEGIDGYFSSTAETEIATRINKLSPDVLLIGISTPIKERFAHKYKNELHARIIIPCGGMIDVYAGITRQAPSLIKKMGLATVYRVIQEPNRLFRKHAWLVSETIFKIIPIAIYYRLILGQKNFNLMEKYLNR